MKTTRQLLEENYTPFKRIAFLILRGHDPFCDFIPGECYDLAHRIVVEFFVSDSLNYTYDGTKGNLEGYFVSYSRKRIMSLRREHNKQLRVLSLEPWMIGMSAVDSTRSSYEKLDWYQSVLALMQKKTFSTVKGCIPFSVVWNVVVLQMLQEGRMTKAHLQRTLKVSKPLAKRMYNRVWEFINGKRAEGLL